MTETEWLASTDPVAMLDWLTTPGSCNGRPWSEWKPSDRKLRLFQCACCRAAGRLLTSVWVREALGVAERYADGEATEADRMAAYERLPRPGDPDFVSSGSQLVTNTLMPNGFRQYIVVGELLNNAVIQCRHCQGTGQEMAFPEAYYDPPAHPITCRWCHGSTLACATGKGLLPYPAQSRIIRDILSNPFRLVTLPVGENCRGCEGRGWTKDHVPYATRDRCDTCHGTGYGPSPVLTPLVQSLAEAAYQERRADGTLDPFRLGLLSDALEEAGLEGDSCACESGWRYRNAGGRFRCDACHGSGRQPNPLLAHLRGPGPHYRGCWAMDLITERN